MQSPLSLQFSIIVIAASPIVIARSVNDEAISQQIETELEIENLSCGVVSVSILNLYSLIGIAKLEPDLSMIRFFSRGVYTERSRSAPSE